VGEYQIPCILCWYGTDDETKYKAFAGRLVSPTEVRCPPLNRTDVVPYANSTIRAWLSFNSIDFEREFSYTFYQPPDVPQTQPQAETPSIISSSPQSVVVSLPLILLGLIASTILLAL